MLINCNKYLIIGTMLFSGCGKYVDNDEQLPPIDKPIEVQIREMFEFIEGPLINYDNKTKEGGNNQCPYLHDKGRNGN